MRKKVIFALIIILLVGLFSWKTFHKNQQQNNPTADAPLENLVIPIPFFNGTDFTSIYTAQEKGFFKQQGLNVTTSENQGSAIAVKLVGANENPLGISDTSTAIISRSKGLPIKIVGIIDQVNRAGIICHAEANVHTLTDLYGKKLGGNVASGPYQQFLILAKEMGLDRSKISEIPDNSLASFLNNNLDCVIHMTDLADGAAQIKNVAVTNLPFRDYGLSLYGLAIIANETALAEKPALIKKAASAIIQGLRYEKENPDDALAAYFSSFPQQKEQADLAAQQFKMNRAIKDTASTPNDGKIDPAVLEKQKGLLSKSGFLEQDINTADLYTNDFTN